MKTNSESEQKTDNQKALNSENKLDKIIDTNRIILNPINNNLNSEEVKIKQLNKDIDNINLYNKNNIEKKSSNSSKIDVVRKNENNSENNSENKKDNLNVSECFEYFLLIFFGIIFTLLLIFISVCVSILGIGLIVSTTKNKKCKVEMYSIIKIITYLYFSLLFFENFFQTLLKSECIENDCSKSGKKVLLFMNKLICLGISLTCLIITQINYNRANNWENCGSIKGWVIYSIVVGYIETIFNFCGFIAVIILLICLDSNSND